MRSNGAEGVGGFPACPLPVRKLEVARADVVETDVAAHRVERVLFGDASDTLSDHHAELGFVVHPLRHAREDDCLSRSDQRVRPFREEKRRGRQLGALLLGVVAVIEADADDLARPLDREGAHERAPARAALA